MPFGASHCPVKFLKAFLDSYEAFMDEYVAFMKKYNLDTDNAIGMPADYTKIMARYTEFETAIDKYDSDEMSVEDAKYYLDVVNRCNQKMLDIYQNYVVLNFAKRI